MSSLKVLALKEPLPAFVLEKAALIAKVKPEDVSVEYAELTDVLSHLDACWRINPDIVIMHIDQAAGYLWVDAKRAGYRHVFYADETRYDGVMCELKLIGFDPVE